MPNFNWLEWNVGIPKELRDKGITNYNCIVPGCGKLWINYDSESNGYTTCFRGNGVHTMFDEVFTNTDEAKEFIINKYLETLDKFMKNEW